MIQPSVHKRDIGIEPYGCGGELGLIGRPSGTYLRDDAATHFLERSALLARSYCCQLDGKRLHILHETLPDSRRIAALAVDEQRDSPNVTAVKEAADHAGVELIPLYAAKPDDYAPAFAAMRDAGADGLQIISAPELVAAASGLAALAIVTCRVHCACRLLGAKRKNICSRLAFPVWTPKRTQVVKLACQSAEISS
jgi:hypothetical protein